MTDVQTGLADSIDISESKAKLDAVAKRLIRHKVILAEIMKACVEEFKDCDVKTIVDQCFVGDVRMDEIAVDQDALDADRRVVGAESEDASVNEGMVRFDLVFEAKTPDTGEIIGLIINVEIQVDVDLGYPLITRAIYYLARLISRQKGTVFTHSDYGKLRKVYSIWICPNPSRVNTNSIAEYGFTQQKVVGSVAEPVANYDKMKAIIISLNDEGMDNRTGIIRLLSALLSTTESVQKRKQIIEEEFSIPMTREIQGEVLSMCNYGSAIQTYSERIGQERGERIGQQRGERIGQERGERIGQQRGERIGIERTTLNSIKSLMETMGWTSQQAMDALKVPIEERKKYLSQL